MRILLTGATGFIGSHVAEKLCKEGYSLLCLKRDSSKLSNCLTFKNQVEWVDSDWMERALDFKPNVIIHCAWKGVHSSERNDWNIQLSNIELISQLLFIAEKTEIKKIISLGSQAEYGALDHCVTENHPLNPLTIYGSIKVAISQMIKTFSELHNIDWYWLRIFSTFGEHESDTWLLPSVIKKMLSSEKEMDFTKGEQEYAYLYIKDLANAVASLLQKDGFSGEYNISSCKPQKLIDVLNFIRVHINPDFKLNLGVLPYRPNQSKHIEGDSSKFIKNFGEFETTNFNSKILELIELYKHESL